MDHKDDLADFSLEDFDRARHRLRLEIAARAAWAGDQPPEQVDIDAMNAYNRAVIAEAANTTRPIDWLAVGVWLFVGLTILDLAVQGVRTWWR